jgi:hypothetical protein
MSSESRELRELNKILQLGDQNPHFDVVQHLAKRVPMADIHGVREDDEDKMLGGLTQFTTNDNISFFPAGSTVATLVPGVYDINMSANRGLYFQKIKVNTDGLLRFPETNSEKVINEIKTFWEREENFLKHGLIYKRGIILWGSQGTGKSCTIQIIIQDVIERQGVVFKFNNPGLFIEGVRQFRQVQPNTPIVVLMEDIDAIIQQWSESEVLNILDGVDQIQKVVFLATTNYPEMLGGRIMNRPSRFDKRFKMGNPSAESRKIYFEHIIDQETKKEFDINIDQWVEDTENMSIAHLKELFVSCCIFGNEYGEAIKILQAMIEDRPKAVDEWQRSPMGLGLGNKKRHND